MSIDYCDDIDRVRGLAFCLLFFSLFTFGLGSKKKFKIRGYLNRYKLPKQTLYFTFDDGPSIHTKKILNILAKHEVQATFFVNGYRNHYRRRKKLRKHGHNLRRFAKTLRRMREEGHSIGNHTNNHFALGSLSKKRIMKEVEKNRVYIEEVLQEKAPKIHFIRPPFGDPWLSKNNRRNRKKKKRVGKILNKMGYVIMWTHKYDSTDSHNWVAGEWREKTKRKKGRSYKKKVKRIVRLLKRRLKKKKSAVVLFHDTHNTLIEILPPVIKYAKRKGYRFDTIENYLRWRYPKIEKKPI